MKLGAERKKLAILAGLLLVAGYFIVTSMFPGQSSTPAPVVRTQPLPVNAWVVTKSLAPANLIASARTGSIVVTAKTGVPVRVISDDELLALAPKPAALVRYGPHSAELVLVNLARQPQAE